MSGDCESGDNEAGDRGRGVPVGMAPLRRTVLASLGAFALLGTARAAAQPMSVPQPARRPATFVAPPVAVEVTARAITNFGKANGIGSPGSRLEFIGGLVLASNHKDFGGWSGLAVTDDGRRLLAISDQGSWMTAELVMDGSGRPRGLADAMLGQISGIGGQVLARARDRDAESLALLDGTLARGSVLISFERNHRIGRFPVSERGLGPPMGYLKMPPDARRMSTNKGIEAVTVLRGGQLKGAVVGFAEEFHDASRNHTGWIWPGGIGSDPQRLGMVNIADFAITDAASLSDGSLLVLERKFRWLEGVKMRIRLVRSADIRPGALLDGEVLLDADMAAEIDNMEALALSRNARGQTVLTIMSDNNFNGFLQRTLLLQFTLDGHTAQRAARP